LRTVAREIGNPGHSPGSKPGTHKNPQPRRFAAPPRIALSLGNSPSPTASCWNFAPEDTPYIY